VHPPIHPPGRAELRQPVGQQERDHESGYEQADDD
jgi:hypothetical protein